jgi:hypothetical protein
VRELRRDAAFMAAARDAERAVVDAERMDSQKKWVGVIMVAVVTACPAHVAVTLAGQSQHHTLLFHAFTLFCMPCKACCSTN